MPERSSKNPKKYIRTPIIVRRSLTDNCISTDDSSNFMNSPLRRKDLQTFSEEKFGNIYKRSNSQNLSNIKSNSSYFFTEGLRKACNFGKIPFIGLKEIKRKKKPQNVSDSNVEQVAQKTDPELDESFKRVFDQNLVKKTTRKGDRIHRDILLDNYLFKRKKKKEFSQNSFKL